MNTKFKSYPFVYKWTEISTNKWYIGSRYALGCHPHDGYICSSKIVMSLILNNPLNWKREILCYGTKEEVLCVEATLLKQEDAKNNPMSYNKNNGSAKTVFDISTEVKTKHKKVYDQKKLDEIVVELQKQGNPYKGKYTLLGHAKIIYNKKYGTELITKKMGRPQILSEEEKKLRKAQANRKYRLKQMAKRKEQRTS